MAETDIIERIKYLMKEMNFRQVEFAQKVDVDASNLSKYLNGRLPISESFLNRVVVNLGVNKDWLETGSDLPFAKPVAPLTTIVTPSSMVTTQQGIPVYDIDVTAGNMPRAQLFAEDHIIGSINLPDFEGQNCRVVRVSGDSMTPVIRSGDLIAVRELNSLQYIIWGQIYVILLDDYRLVKYIRKHENKSQVILRSANPDYDDLEIDRSDIRDLLYVQSIIHIDNRN